MKKWIIKAIVQKFISYLPNSNKINYLFQKYVTKGVILSDEYFTDRLGHGIQHINAHKQHKNFTFNSTLEIGTGWYPVVPVAMFLAGANKIVTVDITHLTNVNKVFTTLKMFVDYQKANKLPKEIIIIEERFKKIESLINNTQAYTLDQLLSELNISYLNCDARKLPFEKESFDLIHSNNTFEHIYEPILEGILKEFKRVLKTGGLMSHFIDMSDHFAHADHSITIYNYLKYTEQQWKRIDNDVQPQNRMRICQYRDLYKKLSINIIEENLRPGNIEEVKSTKLSQPFNQFKIEDVAVSHGYIVSA